MKIVVTGGAGFIGSHVADAALEQGHSVVVVDDLSSGKRENVPAGAEFVELDIRDAEGVRGLIERVRPDAISHQAAQASVAVSVREPARDAAINTVGTVNLLESAMAFGTSQFVFASTGGAIYGEVPEDKQAAVDWDPVPESPYAWSKFSAEWYLRFAAKQSQLRTCVLRYANVYGQRQDPHGEAGVVAIFAQRLIAGEPIQINARKEAGDDGCVRDYVHVSDVVKANLAALGGDIDVPVINIGTGRPTTTRQLAERMAATLGVEPTVRDAGPRAGDLERSVLDASEQARRLGEPVSLDVGLEATCAWFRETAT